MATKGINTVRRNGWSGYSFPEHAVNPSLGARSRLPAAHGSGNEIPRPSFTSRSSLLVAVLLLLVTGAQALQADVYRCATSDEVFQALEVVEPGDTILLEGGKVYEIDKSFVLEANGTDKARITFTSEDATGQDRYAVITTVDGRKEEDMVALLVHGSFWNISRLEVAGKKVPLEDGYWDTNGFRLGMFLNGAGAHHNVIEDVHIHHTHNAAVAVRERSHHNQFRRMKIHHIGEWLSADYNAHEGEGFYLGSSKGLDEAGERAIVHDILIEDSVLGPGLLGQFLDFKYATSRITARNNTLYCNEKTYGQEIVLMAGYANTVSGNTFVGSNENLEYYIRVNNKKTPVPVRVDYLGQKDIPAPTGRDNTVVDNVFYIDNPDIPLIKNDLVKQDRSTLVASGNEKKSLADYEKP